MSGHISVAGSVDRDSLAEVGAATPEKGRVEDQARGDGIELGHKGVKKTLVGRLEGLRGGREVCRSRGSGHISVAGGVDRDSRALVVAAAPEIGRVEQGRAGGIELGHKGVIGTARKLRLEGEQGGREAHRSRVSGHISVADGVDRDAIALVEATVAVGAAAGGIELDHKGVAPTLVVLLEGPRGGREVNRGRGSGHISVAGGVDRDCLAQIVAGAPEIGRVEEARAGGVELGHKGVMGTALIEHPEGPRGGREVRRTRPSGHINGASGVHRDSIADVFAAAPEIGGINNGRIDH